MGISHKMEKQSMHTTYRQYCNRFKSSSKTKKDPTAKKNRQEGLKTKTVLVLDWKGKRRWERRVA